MRKRSTPLGPRSRRMSKSTKSIIQENRVSILVHVLREMMDGNFFQIFIWCLWDLSFCWPTAPEKYNLLGSFYRGHYITNPNIHALV